jgi:hypothetical protein
MSTRQTGLLLLLSFLMSACSIFDSDLSSRKRKKNNDTTEFIENDEEELEDLILQNRFTATNWVDPITGAYQAKLTLPRNFNGKLTLSGENIDKLTEKHVYVRFRFGMNYEPVEVPATVTTAPGILPGSKIQVLIMDLKNRPFSGIDLPYNLFDYNEYDYNDQDTEFAQNNRDRGLFCRGLNSEDDSTKNSIDCSYDDSKCLYSYAKVVDRGWYNSNTQTYIYPSYPQMGIFSDDYWEDDDNVLASKCLDDSARQFYKNDNQIVSSYYYSSLGMTDISMYGEFLSFHGPYESQDQSNWQIQSDALFGEWGLFEKNLENGNDPNFGYHSRLFPIYATRSVASGVDHYSYTRPRNTMFNSYFLRSYASDRESEWMNGCNARVSSRNRVTGEDISSCNVTATIEVFFKDLLKEKEITLIGADPKVDGSISTKIQLVAPASIDPNDGVLLEQFTTCSTNSECGGGECCFNGRCWSEDLVSQCTDHGDDRGYKPEGATCANDFQCSSFCCKEDPQNTNVKMCMKHDMASSEPEDTCRKGLEKSCLISAFCGEVQVNRRVLIKTEAWDGPNGEIPRCKPRCYRVTVPHGDCVDGTCQKPQPFYDPLTPVGGDNGFDDNLPAHCVEALDEDSIPEEWELIEIPANPDVTEENECRFVNIEDL